MRILRRGLLALVLLAALLAISPGLAGHEHPRSAPDPSGACPWCAISSGASVEMPPALAALEPAPEGGAPQASPESRPQALAASSSSPRAPPSHR